MKWTQSDRINMAYSSVLSGMQHKAHSSQWTIIKRYGQPALLYLALYGATFSSQAINVNGYGFHPLGSVIPVLITTSSLNATPVTSSVAPRTFGLFTKMPSATSRSDCSAYTVLPNTLTSDGKYYGWELVPGSGIYGVIYDSSVTAFLDGYYPDPKTSVTVTWGSNGKVSYTSSHGAWGITHCYTSTPTSYTYKYTQGQNTISSGNIKYGIYIASGAAPLTKKYDFAFYIWKWFSNPMSVLQTVDVSFTNCTVATPGQIKFGTVDAGSVTPVISTDSGLDIACAGQPPSVNLSYSAQAVSATRSPTELVMSNSENQTQGVVRGFVGRTAAADAGCSDKTSSVRFGAEATSLATGADNNQALTFPLKWVLCPVASAPPGQGTASAILDIHWQ